MALRIEPTSASELTVLDGADLLITGRASDGRYGKAAVAVDNLLDSVSDQTSQHLAVVNIPRAEAVTRNLAGEWSALSNGTRMNFGGYWFSKLSGATTISDLLGWVPLQPLNILQFASETVLAANARSAIVTGLNYAATLVEDDGLTLDRNGFAAKITFSLANRSWLVSSRVDMSQCAGVELCDGTLEANTATWPSSSTYVLRFGGTNDNNNRYMGLRNIVIRCNKVANGILAENLQNSFAEDIYIHGQTQYGWRKIGPKGGACRFRNIRANEWFQTETGYDAKAGRTSIGISNEIPDEIYENCEGVYCLTNIKLSGTGAHVWRQSHPFHGAMADLSTYTVTGAVSDGTGGTRCTVAATTGLSNGAMVVMPWIDGISGVGGSGGRPGAYAASNVTGTTFDVAGYAFAGAYAASDSPKATLWAEEMVNMLIGSDVTIADIDIEADQGKIKIMQDAGGSPRVNLRVIAAGLSATNARCAVELVADGVSADFAGVKADIHTESSGYRLTAINGGTFSSPIAAHINEFRTDRASRSTALLSVGHGTAIKPSLRFSGLDSGGAISTDANTGFFAHSDHTPALTVDGEEKLHFGPNALEPQNGYFIANTATIAQLITAAAAGDFDDLADNSVVWAGGYPFVKQDGAAYDRLPVGFIPPDSGSAPEHFGAAGTGLVDDTAALIAWSEYGGTMYANGQYLVAAAGPNAGGAYARLLRSVDIVLGPNFKLIAGEGLDNDVWRFTAQWSLYDPDNLPFIKVRGGMIDQSGQCNSTVMPNAASYPPFRPGTSVTCDGLYILGWVIDPGDSSYHAGVGVVDIEGLRTYAGEHWEVAGGDSGIFVGGALTVKTDRNICQGNRDCGIYISELPNGTMVGNSIQANGNIFNACHWGAAAKRVPSGVTMIGNIGNNTPQVLVLSGLTGTDGAGSTISDNIGFNAWQVVRCDNMSGVSVHNNLSYDHGCTLADGSTPTLVFAGHNCVVRFQGMADSVAHGNKLMSIAAHAVTAGWAVNTVKFSIGPSIGGTTAPTSNCRAYDNQGFAGTNVVTEEAGETEDCTFWGNTGTDAMSTWVNVVGAGSIDRDALTEWNSATDTVTGTTATTDLKTATVKARKLVRSGDRLKFEAAGQFTGASGTKQIFVVVGPATIGLPVSAAGATGAWSVTGSLIFTGSSVRYNLQYATEAGGVSAKNGTASVTASADWTVKVRGDLSVGTDSITCTQLWIK